MRKRQKDIRRYIPLFIMMLPAVIYLFINNYLPMFGMIIAFKDLDFSKGILQSNWVGFANFKYLFATEDALMITRNTIIYNLVFIAFNTCAAIIIAVLLNEIKKKLALKIYQSVILIPSLISMVMVSYLVLAFLSSESGLINKSILPLLGMEPRAWYNETGPWPLILVFVNAWKNVGFLAIIFYSAIIGIETEMYEAAMIDGASRLQQIFRITIPQIVPVVTFMVLMMIGRVFYADFGLFFQVPLDSGSLYPVTNVIDTYVYRALMQIGDISMSAAAGFYQSIVGFIFVLVANLIIRKINPENALF